MTFNGLFVYKKLNKIEEYLEELEEFLKFTDKEIFDDSMKMHIGERLFQLIIDEILDINQHFIGELDLKLTEDFQGTFDALADNKIISKEFSNKISGVVNLRNIIVHDYEKFDKKLFLKDLRKNYSDFKKYIKFIVKFLEK
ncbi:MAG: hypothetical protein US35_C0024G0007 [Parcubacteria group bacterium GW2011_GWA2_37_10]|nr:MAG: hypothetical protein US35_C0024G0007 [Parcubacteria group bacterium GW2011_GWA2_37_10]